MTNPSITLKGGLSIPALGQGTWCMGRSAASRDSEVAALRAGLDLGLTLIDTAEMYDDAESVVGEAIRGRRDDVFIVSKVLPDNASLDGTIRAAERSLEALGTDVIDLYLLHWPGTHPLEDTLAAFGKLRDAGKIRSYGVSNFDRSGLERALATPGGEGIECNQILYNLARRGPEFDLMPFCREHDVVVMAYSPLDQGRADFGGCAAVAERRGVTPAQVAIAWTLREGDVVSIPKAVSLDHVRANAGVLDLELDAEDLARLDADFPAPRQAMPLEWL